MDEIEREPICVACPDYAEFSHLADMIEEISSRWMIQVPMSVQCLFRKYEPHILRLEGTYRVLLTVESIVSRNDPGS